MPGSTSTRAKRVPPFRVVRDADAISELLGPLPGRLSHADKGARFDTARPATKTRRDKIGAQTRVCPRRHGNRGINFTTRDRTGTCSDLRVGNVMAHETHATHRQTIFGELLAECQANPMNGGGARARRAALASRARGAPILELSTETNLSPPMSQLFAKGVSVVHRYILSLAVIEWIKEMQERCGG